MDVIKTQQQGYYHQATIQNGASGQQLQHIRWQVAAKKLYHDRGVVGFWDGLVRISTLSSFIPSPLVLFA